MTVGPSPTDGSAGGGGGGGGHGGASIGGIVAGVVVGLIVIGCISAAVLFLVRRRKWRQSDALDGSNSSNPFSDANKQHSINSAVPNDSRLDPSLMRRRMSDGSIADNEDFSRRILTVR